MRLFELASFCRLGIREFRQDARYSELAALGYDYVLQLIGLRVFRQTISRCRTDNGSVIMHSFFLILLQALAIPHQSLTTREATFTSPGSGSTPDSPTDGRLRLIWPTDPDARGSGSSRRSRRPGAAKSSRSRSPPSVGTRSTSAWIGPGI